MTYDYIEYIHKLYIARLPNNYWLMQMDGYPMNEMNRTAGLFDMIMDEALDLVVKRCKENDMTVEDAQEIFSLLHMNLNEQKTTDISGCF